MARRCGRHERVSRVIELKGNEYAGVTGFRGQFAWELLCGRCGKQMARSGPRKTVAEAEAWGADFLKSPLCPR